MDLMEYPSVTYTDNNGVVHYGLPSELNSKIKAAWIPYGKSNQDDDRDIIYDYSGNGHDLSLTGFNWTKDSGYSEYSNDFTKWNSSTTYVGSVSPGKVIGNGVSTEGLGRYYLTIGPGSSIIPNSFKVRVSGLDNKGDNISYQYTDDSGVLNGITISTNGVYDLPGSSKYSSYNGFNINTKSNSIITIEQIPDNGGALVTSGSEDELISSIESVSDITNQSETITVLSVAENLDDKEINLNFISGNKYGFNIRNYLRSGAGLSVAGYSATSDSNSPTLINNILGDKSKITSMDGYKLTQNEKILINKGAGGVGQFKMAWYGTIIAVGELSEYEICTLLSYYILDRLIKPIIYYDIKKQGLTNNTPDSDWYLKDFSLNGHDMQLFNFAKKLNSGVGKYEVDFMDYSIVPNVVNITRTSDKLSATNNDKIGQMIIYKNISDSSKANTPAFKIKISNLTDSIRYYYIDESDTTKRSSINIISDGIYDLPESKNTLFSGATSVNIGFGMDSGGYVTIEQIPSHMDALCFDGIDDYGQYVGDLGLKDYTIVVDRAYTKLNTPQIPIISDSTGDNANTPFLIEHVDTKGDQYTYSFNTNDKVSFSKDRQFTYQSTYKYNNVDIRRGSSTNTGSGLTIGKYGINSSYSNIALYSLLLYPYSLNEFLINRQLKKLNIGELHFSKVYWYPVVNSDLKLYDITYTTVKDNTITQLESGNYYEYEGTTLKISIDIYDVNLISSVKINGVECTSEIPGIYVSSMPSTYPQSIEIISSSTEFVLENGTWNSQGIWKSTGVFRF